MVEMRNKNFKSNLTRILKGIQFCFKVKRQMSVHVHTKVNISSLSKSCIYSLDFLNVDIKLQAYSTEKH